MIKTEKKRIKNTVAKSADRKAGIHHLRTDQLKKTYEPQIFAQRTKKDGKKFERTRNFVILMIFIAN